MSTESPSNLQDPTLDDCVEAYESARAEMGTVQVQDFLPTLHHPRYHEIAVELLRVDLEYAWRNGEKDAFDQHLLAFPTVRQNPESLSQIAYEDYRLRQQFGDPVGPDYYRDRYGVVVSDWDDASSRDSVEVANTPDEAVDGLSHAGLSYTGLSDDGLSDDELTEPPRPLHDTATQFQTASSPSELVDIVPGSRFLNFEV
ncbi:MAG: hypothetical protein KDA85_02210, partial [Planctomycetaceae bacterium]|nr:hypothetical protein [Planctomycetaceae bacterium]